MNSSLITHLQTAAEKLEIDPNSRLGNDLKTLAHKSARSIVKIFSPVGLMSVGVWQTSMLGTTSTSVRAHISSQLTNPVS